MLSSDDIRQDRASIQKFKGELPSLPFYARGTVSHALDRWSAALDEVESLQQAASDAKDNAT